MKYKIFTISSFDKQFKRLIKKYPSLKKDITNLVTKLEINPTEGVSLRNGFYKIRLTITSKGKGKSGGGRVITNFIVHKKVVFLVAIYDKSEKTNITNKELSELYQQVLLEI